MELVDVLPSLMITALKGRGAVRMHSLIALCVSILVGKSSGDRHALTLQREVQAREVHARSETLFQ